MFGIIILTSFASLERILVWSRLGKVKPSECSLFVAMSSPHRKEGFLACEYCVEMIKKKSLFGKKKFLKTVHFNGNNEKIKR